MRWFLAFLLVLAVARGVEPIEWGELAPLPDEHGFAGPFAGVTGGRLVVAGGANFPQGYPWDGGAKVWHDRIFVSDETGSRWEEVAERLPRALGYGVSVTVPQRGSVFFIGGNDAERSYAEVYEVTWKGGIRIEARASLPVASAMGCGVLLGDSIYVAGGTDDGERALARCFRMDLAAEVLAWDEVPWPKGARGRVLAVAGVQGGEFYLVSGCDLGAESWDKRTYLRDGYAYSPSSGEWREIAMLPRAVAAAPSPMVPAGQAGLLVMGGAYREFVDGQRRLRPETNGNGVEHPGFVKEVLAYDRITDTWTGAGEVAAEFVPVTATAVAWDGNWVVPTGEVKPGIRSPQVISATVTGAKKAFGAANWAVLVIYLLGVVVVGLWFTRKGNDTTDEYFRAGQRVPWIVAGLSIFATMLSAITFMSIPARVYQTDMAYYLGQPAMLLVAPIVILFYLPKFRKFNVTSAYEYLEERFGAGVRAYASVSFMLYHVGRVAVVLYLPALALAQVSPVSVTTCVLIIGVLCVIYTVFGGIEAVVWTDAVQAVVLLGGALLCFVLAVVRVDGGAGEVWRTAVADEKVMQSLTWSLDWRDGTASAIVLFVAFFFNALVPYTSGQDVVQRYVTTSTEAGARRSLWTTAWLSVFGGMIFFGLGVAVYAFYKGSPELIDPGMAKTDAVLAYFVLQQLPAGVAGLVIAAVFAASQSTVSSSLNSIATSYVTDLHGRFFRPESSDRQRLAVAKLVVVCVGVLGIVAGIAMAGAGIESAFKTFNKLIGLAAGSLGGLFALGVFTKRGSGTGALVAALCGTGVVLGLYLSDSPVSGLLYAVIGMVVCVGVGLVSRGKVA